MNKIIFKKISAETLLELLSSLHEDGVKYIDIHAVSNAEQDEIFIAAHEEHEENIVPNKLTDNDINQLI